jgi:cysteine desulfurase / selenocysteine lyase
MQVTDKDWTRVHADFPVNDRWVWLNNCGTTPAGRHVVSAVNRFISGYAQDGVFTDAASLAGLRRRIKEILAGLLNCQPDELALIHHTAEGMNFISHGLRFAEGDEVILLENEYPSNIYPWRHLEGKGVTIRTAPMGESPDEFFEGLTRMVGKRTRLIALSAVHWCTGMPLPLSEVGSLCRERGIDFVVDGAQGVGMRPIDVAADGIHFMAFSAWKWLMGPLGLGVLYVARDRLEDLDPVFIGTESVVNDTEYLPYKDTLKPTADRFSISTPSVLDWIYFAAALEYLAEIGFQAVRERIWDLADRLRDGLSDAGFDLPASRFPDHRTGIVVCERRGVASADLVARLKGHRIAAAERLSRVRLSPHIYLLPEQIDRAVEVLAGGS